MKKISEEQKTQMLTIGAWVLGVGVGLWILYTYVLMGMWLGPREQLAKDRVTLVKQRVQNKQILQNAANDTVIWNTLGIRDASTDSNARDSTGALVSDTYVAAASKAGINFIGWNDTGTRAAPGKQDFQELKFTAQAITTTARLARFLYVIETNNTVPARIDDLTVKARKPGVDDLHIDVTIVAVVYNPKVPIRPATARAVPATRGNATQPGRGTGTPSSRGPGGGTAAPTPELDPAAMALKEAEMAKKVAAQKAAAAVEEARLATMPKPPVLTPEEKIKQMEARRLQELGADATPGSTTAPATQGATQ